MPVLACNVEHAMCPNRMLHFKRSHRNLPSWLRPRTATLAGKIHGYPVSKIANGRTMIIARVVNISVEAHSLT